MYISNDPFADAAGGTFAQCIKKIPLFLVTERGRELDFVNRIFGISRVGSLFITLLIGFALDRFSVKKIIAFILLGAGLSTVVGVGLSPFILGAIADAWNYQGGIFFLGLFVSLSCLFLRWLQDV